MEKVPLRLAPLSENVRYYSDAVNRHSKSDSINEKSCSSGESMISKMTKNSNDVLEKIANIHFDNDQN